MTNEPTPFPEIILEAKKTDTYSNYQLTQAALSLKPVPHKIQVIENGQTHVALI